MMHCKLQIVFDQALFSNTNARFEDCCSIEPYNRTVDSYGMFNSNEQTAQLRLDRLKIDQVSPVSIFGLIGKAGTGMEYGTVRAK